MEPLGLGVIFSALTGTIGTLFWQLLRERDKREAAAEAAHKQAIEDMRAAHKREVDDLRGDLDKVEAENGELKARVEKQSSIIAENTAALTLAAESQEKMVRFLTGDKAQ